MTSFSLLNQFSFLKYKISMKLEENRVVILKFYLNSKLCKLTLAVTFLFHCNFFLVVGAGNLL